MDLTSALETGILPSLGVIAKWLIAEIAEAYILFVSKPYLYAMAIVVSTFSQSPFHGSRKIIYTASLAVNSVLHDSIRFPNQDHGYQSYRPSHLHWSGYRLPLSHSEDYIK